MGDNLLETREGECPTCSGPVTIEYREHEQYSIVGTERWVSTHYTAKIAPRLGRYPSSNLQDDDYEPTTGAS